MCRPPGAFQNHTLGVAKMSTLGIEKRTEKLFVRITPSNKEWLQAEAARVDMPEAEIVDFLISEKKNASNSAKSRRRPKKA